jgi:uncharacterized protein YkwD
MQILNDPISSAAETGAPMRSRHTIPGRWRPYCLFALTLLAAARLPAASRKADDSAPPALSLKEKQQVRSLLARLKSAGHRDDGKRREMIDQLLQFDHPTAANSLLKIFDQEDRSSLSTYEQGVKKVADVLLSRRESLGSEERLYEKAVAKALKTAEKEDITVGWQAMAALKQHYVLTSAEILDASSSLRKVRDQLLENAPNRSRCYQTIRKHGGTAPTDFESRLDAITVDYASRAFVKNRKQAAIMKDNAALFSQIDLEEAAGIRDLNVMRILMGLTPLMLDPALCQAAHDHSKDMVEHNFFSHESPVPGKKSFTDRARLAGAAAGGENIFYGSAHAVGANRWWFHSPGHFGNMFGAGYRRGGVGHHDGRWTQLFGR